MTLTTLSSHSLLCCVVDKCVLLLWILTTSLPLVRLLYYTCSRSRAYYNYSDEFKHILNIKPWCSSKLISSLLRLLNSLVYVVTCLLVQIRINLLEFLYFKKRIDTHAQKPIKLRGSF